MEKETVIVEITREPWHVAVRGTVKEPDVALAALRQAVEDFELIKLINRLDQHVAAQSAVATIVDAAGKKVSA